MLLDSYRRDADLTEIGSKMCRFFVRNAFVARLLSQPAWKQYPQHAEVTIERPIFVTGLPRTGTTADPSATGCRSDTPGSGAMVGGIPATAATT